jgi:hypothetical protein
MNIFGNYSKAQKQHTFEKNPEAFWVFRYPTADDEAQIERFMRRNPSTTEIFVLELALTFAETNLGVTEEDPDPYIQPDAPIGIKQALIGKMPYEMILELAEALNAFHSGWGLKSQEEQAEDK